MGEHDVSGQLDEHRLRAFSKALLDDVHALEKMLETPDMFESGLRRVGAEQEMFLVDEHMRPAPVSTEVLARAGDDRLTTELAKFNLEANLAPHVFRGRCLRSLEMELEDVLSVTRAAAEACGARILLTGILPTLRRSDLGLGNMSPMPRYLALNRAMTELRGGDFHVLVKGVDELEIHHDNVMLESCTTSFQVHFQVTPHEFARLYNLAQAVAGPVLAVAVNSPVLLGQRLWNETRIALFQRSVDSRSKAFQERGRRPRVSFGDAWVRESVLEIFREDIARFRVLLATGIDGDPLGALDRGEVPKLSALRLHNGTVYRWNRACYGVADGKAHLRIENRVLPAGPTVIDEIANAAFFFGLMAALADEYGDIDKVMSFDDAKNNFFAAARTGLKAQFTWVGGRTVTAAGLIVDELLPMARAGLEQTGIDSTDVDRYLGVIEERVRSGRTGAQWMLESLAGMAGGATPDIRERTLTASILEQQRAGAPVHAWSLSVLRPSGEDWRRGYQTVDQFMTTDLFTVRPEDLVDLAASVMDWEHIRHVPVEDDDGRLVGLVSHRALLRLVARGRSGEGGDPVPVSAIMKTEPVTIPPTTPTLEAMRLMREGKLGCLPVVSEGRLVGLVTEHDLIEVSAILLEKFLQGH